MDAECITNLEMLRGVMMAALRGGDGVRWWEDIADGGRGELRSWRPPAGGNCYWWPRSSSSFFLISYENEQDHIDLAVAAPDGEFVLDLFVWIEGFVPDMLVFHSVPAW